MVNYLRIFLSKYTKESKLLSKISAIAFYDKPYIKFERLLETYHAYAPKGLKSFPAAVPVWIKEKLFMKKMLWDGLESLSGDNLSKKPPLYFPEHHLSHAASAFYPSPFDKAAILTIDGVGEWATTTICFGEGSDITILKELPFPHFIFPEGNRKVNSHSLIWIWHWQYSKCLSATLSSEIRYTRSYSHRLFCTCSDC